jgi:hypothetical protein
VSSRWLRVPRITGQLLTQETHPCGRLVAPEDFKMDDYDYKEKVGVFIVPSLSRPETRVYGVELDFRSAEILCGCEALKEFREASRMPYNRRVAGTYLEQIARAKRMLIAPLITRQPRYLCPHARKVRLFAMRHGLMPYFYEREAQGTRYVERMEVPKAA